MKVLLFTGYGEAAYTPKMKEIMDSYKNSICKRAGFIIEYIESNCEVYIDEKSMMKALEKNNKDYEKIVSCKSFPGVYCCLNPTSRTTFVSSFSIVDVDITRLWTIEEYDGSEYIQYLDDYKLVDKELNYYEKK